MNGPHVVAVYCTHFPQQLVQEKKEKTEELRGKIGQKCGHISIWLFLRPVQIFFRSATVTSTQNI